MVLDKDFKPLHQLTSRGEEEYKRLLEAEADEILLKHEHPFRWICNKMKDVISK